MDVSVWNNVEGGVRAWWEAITSKRWSSLMDVSVWNNVVCVRGGRQSLPRDGQVLMDVSVWNNVGLGVQVGGNHFQEMVQLDGRFSVE